MPNTRAKTHKNLDTASVAKEVTSRVERLSSQFQGEMQKFRDELTALRQNDAGSEPTDVATVDELLAKFNEFQILMESGIKSLGAEIGRLTSTVADISRQADLNCQKSYQNRLLIYGVAENAQETPESIMSSVIDVVNEKMRHKNVALRLDDLSDCYRFGKRKPDKPRAILITFVRVIKRNIIFASKSAFKGTRVLVAEFLTRRRYAIFRAARSRYKDNCWTRNGDVYVLVDGERRMLRGEGDLD